MQLHVLIIWQYTKFFSEGELDANVVVRKNRTTTQHGAIEGKAIAEYRKYQARALTPVERAYIAQLEATIKDSKQK